MPGTPSMAPANVASVPADGLVNFGIARPDFFAALPRLPGDMPPNMKHEDSAVDQLPPPGWRRPARHPRLFREMTYGSMTAESVTLGLASRWTRFLGQMIDGSFAMIPMALAAVLARFGLASLLPVIALPAAAWSFFYLFCADGLPEGPSFAKQWLGVRVIDAKTGDPCTFGQSFVRNIFTILGPIDWIFIFGDAHQRLGDKAAGTIVVEAD